MDGVAEDGDDAAGFLVDVHEGIAVNSVFAVPADGELRVGFLEVNVVRIAVPCQPRRQAIFRVEQPGISCVGREQHQGTDRHEAPIMLSGAALNVSDLIGEIEVLAIDLLLAQPAFDGLPAHWFPPPVQSKVR